MFETHRPLAAALWMIGAIAAFSSMAVAGRAVSTDLDTFEIMTWRSLIGICIVTAVGYSRGTLGQIRTDRLPLHLARNICHFSGQNLWFFAITVIPLAQVFALEFTAPLWVVLLSPLLLGERITRRRAFAAALGFTGILIVARPQIDAISPGVVTASLAAIAFAGSAIFTKRLTRHESITSILFWLTVMQAVFGLVMAGHDGSITLPSAHALPWVVVISCAGLFAHFCLTTALSLAPATFVMPIDFARLPVIAIVAMLLYGEPVDSYVFLGGAIILLANWLNLRSPSGASMSQRTAG